MKHANLAIPLILAGLLAAEAPARELVVDAANAAASDTGPGTAAQPLKTIGQAATLADPGDRVVVKAGVYRESVRLRKSGRAGEPITFAADPPGSVVVTGADVIADWTRLEGDAPVYRTPWPHRFVIGQRNGKPVMHHPADAPVWGRAEQVVADGRHLVPTGTLADLRKAWADHREPWAASRGEIPLTPDPKRGETWAGLFAVDTDRQELYVCLADGSEPKAHRVEAATRGQVFGVNQWQQADGVAHVHVRGFVFRYGATFPQRPAVSLHGRDNVVEDCIVEDMAGGGISVPGGVLRRCIVRRCGHTGGGAQGSGFLNEGCLWEGNCWKPINRGWDAGGFKICRAHGGVFRRCSFVRNGGDGLWLDIDDSDITITECAFVENEHSGLFIEISRNITVARCLALRNGLAAIGTEASHGWSVAGIQIAESGNCTVAFNTCVGNKDGIALREQGPRELDTPDFGRIPYHNAGHVIVGNVCAMNRGYQLALWYDNCFFGWHPAEARKFKSQQEWAEQLKDSKQRPYDPTAQQLTIDHNLYFAAPGQKLILYGVPWRPKFKQFADLPAFTAQTGFDRTSQVANPRFVDAAGDRFRFAADSPALNLRAGWLTAPADLKAWMAVGNPQAAGKRTKN